MFPFFEFKNTCGCALSSIIMFYVLSSFSSEAITYESIALVHDGSSLPPDQYTHGYFTHLIT